MIALVIGGSGSGKSAYAEKLVEGSAKPGACPVGGETLTAKIAEILGVKPGKNTRINRVALYQGEYGPDSIPPYVPRGYEVEMLISYIMDNGNLNGLASATVV